MPTTTVPTAVFHHPTNQPSFDRTASSGSSRSSWEAGAELGLVLEKVGEWCVVAETPQTTAVRVGDVGPELGGALHGRDGPRDGGNGAVARL